MGKPQRRPGTSAPARLVVWLSVAAHVATVAHLLLVRHQACPEHGELLHGEAHDRSAAAEALPPQDGWLVASAAGEPDEHEHCSDACERRKQALPAAGHVSLPPSRSGDASAARSVAARAGIDVLSFAPKQSPPAV